MKIAKKFVAVMQECSHIAKHIPSRRSPRGEGLAAFPKLATSPRFTLLSPWSRTLDQKITFEVISQGGQLSLARQVLQNSR